MQLTAMQLTIEDLRNIAERDARRAFGCSAKEAWARIARGDAEVFRSRVVVGVLINKSRTWVVCGEDRRTTTHSWPQLSRVDIWVRPGAWFCDVHVPFPKLTV